MAVNAFGIVLFACEMGERISDAFDEINDAISEFHWYLFPNKWKKVLAIIIQFSDQPVDIEFFGSISANRPTFNNVSGVTYLFSHNTENFTH